MTDLEALLKKSVAELTERFFDRARPVPLGLLERLESDPRHAAQELARKIRERRRKERAEGQRLRHLLKFERELWAGGTLHIAGVDEAGMAPLAGPVVAAAAILPRDWTLRGLDDSKKILDEEKREGFAEQIKASAVAWAIGRAEIEEIDGLNIYHAGLLAMRRAVEGLGVPPEFLLVDARKVPGVTIPQRGIIHGDALSLSIAAASILAKTTRDSLMQKLDAEYPGYGFATHKGYPTPAHFKAPKALGVCPIHRRSFGIVKQMVRAAAGFPAPEQQSLFDEVGSAAKMPHSAEGEPLVAPGLSAPSLSKSGA